MGLSSFINNILKSIFLNMVPEEDRGWAPLKQFYYSEFGAADAAQELVKKLSEAGIEARTKDSPVTYTSIRTGASISILVRAEDFSAAKQLLRK